PDPVLRPPRHVPPHFLSLPPDPAPIPYQLSRDPFLPYRSTVRRPPRAALLGPREHGVLALLAERHVGRHERLARGAARRRLHLQGRDRSLALSRTEGHPHRPAGPDRPRGVHVICVPDTRPGL